jgi:hypothetical protein
VTGNRRLLDLLGVELVVADPAVPGFPTLGRYGEVSLQENPSAFPRAWVVASTRPLAGDPHGALLDPTVDLRDVALSADALSINGSSADARVVSDTGNRLEVAATGPGLLVLADRWARGWSATVSGVPATIWRVDGVLRGVELPPGAQTVTFVYEPTTWRIGVAIGAFGLLGLAALLVVALAPWGRGLRA